MQSVRADEDSLSDSAGTAMLMHSTDTDDAVSNVTAHSQVSAVDSCGVADVGLSADSSASDADTSRRRHPRRKLSTNTQILLHHICICKEISY